MQLQGYLKREYKLVRKKLLKLELQDEEVVVAGTLITKQPFISAVLEVPRYRRGKRQSEDIGRNRDWHNGMININLPVTKWEQ